MSIYLFIERDYIYIYTHTHIYRYIHMYICMYIHMYTYVCPESKMSSSRRAAEYRSALESGFLKLRTRIATPRST